MTTYEKIVKGATKVKVAAPKPKYIEPILMTTSIDHHFEADNFNTVMRSLQIRLQDSAWSVVYKALIVVHIMIREGDRDVTLKYLADKAPHMLNLSDSNLTRGHGFNSDIKFIVKYAKYLHTRVKQYHETEIDYVRDERANNLTNQVGGRLRELSVEKGLLRESESVQKQIDALLRNNFVENEINNDIVLTAFRLLVNDLLALFQELNEGVINLLEHYFEMSKFDAERALKIYKKFVDQTKYVIDYLRVAKHLEYATKLHVPTIKHAPTALTSSLEEYLDDPNFEVNRRQYMAEKSNKGGTQPPSIMNKAEPVEQKQRPESLIVQQSTYNPWGQNFAPALATIPQGQDYQQQLQQQQQLQLQQQQQLQLQQQQLQQNQMNPAFTGAGFGGYGAQPVPAQATGTNPFLQQTQPTTTEAFNNHVQQSTSLLQPQYTQQNQFQPQQNPGLSRSNTNPFAKMAATATGTPITNTGSNPFANSRFSSNSNTTALSFNNANSAQAINPTSTGSNPFKVSQNTTNVFNQAQKAQQPLKPQATAGGLENLPTVAVFPQTQQEQQRNMYLSNAQTGLHQQATGYQQQQGYQPQSTGFQQQGQQQNTGFQQQGFQQNTGFQNSGFQQDGYQQTGQLGGYQQQIPLQQQPTYAHYNGPSLI